MSISARITAIGSYVPEKRLSNQDLQQLVDTNDEWIVQRTGIKERRIAGENEFTSDLCAAAAEDMVRRYGVALGDVDLILVCTHTPDLPFPSAACLVQDKLGIPAAGAMDLNATCAGFVYGLHTAAGLVTAGLNRKVLVFGADTMSKITDYTDRTTCILFGDGAGAVLVEAAEDGAEEGSAFLAHHMDSDGSGGRHVYRTGLADSLNGMPLLGNGRTVQNGREVYRWAVSEVPTGMQKVAEKAGLSLADIRWFIPHSANLRIIESICEKSGYPLEQTLYSLVHFGNTSAASIPLALNSAVRENRIGRGDTLLLYGFGAGLVQAGLLLRWTL